jgi:hypothetical protein
MSSVILRTLEDLEIPSSRTGKTLREKFASSFIVDPDTGCWNSRNLDPHGYGMIASGKRGVKLLSHRISWQMFNKQIIAASTCVLHRCDNPACVNPDHLFTGTRGDNNRDSVSKNRQARGSKNGLSKLTERDVLKIRASQKSERKIAKEFGVTRGAIHPIRHRITWKHI